MAISMFVFLAFMVVSTTVASWDITQFLFSSVFTRDEEQRKASQDLLGSFIINHQIAIWDSFHSTVNSVESGVNKSIQWIKDALVTTGKAIAGLFVGTFMVIGFAVIAPVVLIGGLLSLAVLQLFVGCSNLIDWAGRKVEEIKEARKAKAEYKARKAEQDAEWNALVAEALEGEEDVQEFSWLQRLLGVDKICGRLDNLEVRVAAIEEKLSEVAPQPIPVETVEAILEEPEMSFMTRLHGEGKEWWTAIDPEEMKAGSPARGFIKGRMINEFGRVQGVVLYNQWKLSSNIIDIEVTDMSVVKQITDGGAVTVLTIEMIESMKWNEMQKLAKAANVSYVKKEGKEGLKLRLIKSCLLYTSPSPRD